jgi:hypothetical protein
VAVALVRVEETMRAAVAAMLETEEEAMTRLAAFKLPEKVASLAFICPLRFRFLKLASAFGKLFSPAP